MRGHKEWLSPRLGPAPVPPRSTGLAAPALSQEGPQGVWDPHRALGTLNPPWTGCPKVSSHRRSGKEGREGALGTAEGLSSVSSTPATPVQGRGTAKCPRQPRVGACPASLSISRGTSPFPRLLHPHPRALGGSRPHRAAPKPRHIPKHQSQGRWELEEPIPVTWGSQGAQPIVGSLDPTRLGASATPEG